MTYHGGPRLVDTLFPSSPVCGAESIDMWKCQVLSAAPNHRKEGRREEGKKEELCQNEFTENDASVQAICTLFLTESILQQVKKTLFHQTGVGGVRGWSERLASRRLTGEPGALQFYAERAD